MKNSIIITYLAVGLSGLLLLFSCKENQPRGDEFGWSPDGKKLAMVNVESKELLVVEFESNQIQRVVAIDSLSGEQARFHQPTWSPDGSYLLYGKSSKKAMEIVSYAMAENQLHPIDRYPLDEKSSDYGNLFLYWLPGQNRMLWSSWGATAGYRIFSARADGAERRLLLNLAGDRHAAAPAGSPDGKWIAYGKYVQEGHRGNGLWIVKSDGSNNHPIYPANEIAALRWHPDGLHLAVVTRIISGQIRQQDGSKQTQYQFQLLWMDIEGKNDKALFKTAKQITALAWSPDGKQLAFFEQQDNASDVWVVNINSNETVKINSGKVQRLFGWNHANQLFYATDYPQRLVTETKEQKDARELLETLRGLQQENLLASYETGRRRNQNENIFAVACGDQSLAMAFYQSFKPNITSSEIYCPVIQLSNGERFYFARTKSQHLATADECYLSHNYPAALDHLSQYWELDFESPGFREQLDAARMIEKLKLVPDSSGIQRSIEALKDGSLLRTVLTLRKLNRTATADWLWQQLQTLTYYISATGDNHKKDMLDEIFWSFLGIYSKYDELAPGISDLDGLLLPDIQDSSLIAFSNYAQGMLAIQNKQPELCLQKMATAINWLPLSMAALDDIQGMLSLCWARLSQDKIALLIPILQEAIGRFADNKDVFRMYDLLGDVYRQQGENDKALLAYQQAVCLNFNDNDIWDKIFEMR